jgi:hypothetical protein
VKSKICLCPLTKLEDLTVLVDFMLWVWLTLLLKLLSPSPYSALYHGIMQSYDWINFFISSHVFIHPQEWIKSSATIAGWFSVLRTQNKQPLYATHEYRRWSLYWTISCRKNPLSTELFNIDNSTAEKFILFPTYCSYILTLYIAHFYPYSAYGEFVLYQFPQLLRFDEINVFLLFIYQIATYGLSSTNFSTNMYSSLHKEIKAKIRSKSK